MAKKTFGFEGIVARAREHQSQLDKDIRKSIVIDPDLHSLIPPLSKEELQQLTENLLEEGCREALVVWPVEDRYVLVDGHNRYAICNREGLDYKVVEKVFADRLAVEQWMILNQLGRRNLTAEQVAYFRGKRYQNEKEQGKRKDLTSGQNDQKSTASRIAQEMKVGEKTIRRDALFAQGVDVIAGVEPALKTNILSGQSSLSKQSIEAMANLKDLPANEVAQRVLSLTKQRVSGEENDKRKTPADGVSVDAGSDAAARSLQQSIHQQLEALIRRPLPGKLKQLQATLKELEQLLFQ